jgi:hypothetical protein
MKQLCSSSDLRELTELVQRLVVLGIPCAVCKDGGSSQVSVWIQQDHDFPLALKIYVERKAPQPVPPWAYLIDAPEPAAEESAVAGVGETGLHHTAGTSGPSVVFVQTRGRTRTGSVERTQEAGGRQPRRTERRGEGRHWGARPERI